MFCACGILCRVRGMSCIYVDYINVDASADEAGASPPFPDTLDLERDAIPC